MLSGTLYNLEIPFGFNPFCIIVNNADPNEMPSSAFVSFVPKPCHCAHFKVSSADLGSQCS